MVGSSEKLNNKKSSIKRLNFLKIQPKKNTGKGKFNKKEENEENLAKQKLQIIQQQALKLQKISEKFIN